MSTKNMPAGRTVLPQKPAAQEPLFNAKEAHMCAVMPYKKEFVCSVPQNQFDHFWVSMRKRGYECHNVKADRMCPGNVLICIKKSRARNKSQFDPVSDEEVLRAVEFAERVMILKDDGVRCEHDLRVLRILCEQTRQRLNSVPPKGYKWELVRE